MKKILLLMVAALFLCGVTSAQNWGTPDSHAKSSNTPIVAKVTLGETVQEAGTLGAFVGDELRGLATIHTDGNFWIQAFYNEGETNPDAFTFKFYDGEQEYTNCTTTLTGQEEGYGTPNSPVELVFAVEQTMTQTSTLAAGWTWWSTPIEQNGINGLQMLESSLSEFGDRIQTQGGTLIKRPNGTWAGSITSLLNEKCYKINVTDVSTVTLTGVVANPSDHAITINNGWNWIGYPVNAPQTANLALANLEPETGDIIMRQGGSATYRNGQWLPVTFTLTPGLGYLYNSKASDPKTFTYANSRSNMPLGIQEEPFWTANIHEYENCMVVIAIVYVGKDEQRDESIELAAFVNSKCTGSANLFYVEDLDRYCSILTIGGNEGDRISFAMVDGMKGVLYQESDNSLVFSENAIVGDLDNPYEIHFNNLGMGETSMQIAMYPNPVSRGEAFRLNVPQDETISDLMIINALGSVVRHNTGALKTMTAGLPVPGVYTIKVTCRSGNTYYGKLVVR